MRVHVEKRLVTPNWMELTIPIISVMMAFLLGAALILFTGHNPVNIYSSMIEGTFGTSYAISETIVKAIPLMLTGLGVSVAMRMNLWNIGATGQLLMGAFVSTWVALNFSDLPWYFMMPTLIVTSFLGGGLWALLAGIFKSLWDISEIITTLMLNYVAALWVRYLVQGPWRDPELVLYPFSAEFPDSAKLATFGETRVHLGLVFAIIAAIILLIVLKRSLFGYEIKVIGSNQKTAVYAGIDVFRNVLLTMFISGGLSGIAGMAELSGVFYRLQDNLAGNAGYTAIIIASLAGGSPIGTLLIAFFFAALLVGGKAAQTAGISASIAYMLQGAVLFFVLAGQFFLKYRVRFETGRKDLETSTTSSGG